MADLTPRLSIPVPSEFEEPYYETSRDGSLALDSIGYSNAENSQLQFLSTGSVGWDVAGAPPNGLVYWTEDIDVTGFSDAFKAYIAGGASVEMQDGEVLFFLLPRALRARTELTLYRSNRIFLEGSRLPDLRLFCARVGDKLYFQNGLSLKDGQEGELFGGGLFPSTITPIHQHEPALVIQPPSAGVSTLDAGITAPDLIKVEVYRNGQLLAAPDDYTINLGTGIVTLVIPTVHGSERFVLLRETRDPISLTLGHSHLSTLVLKPAPATALLDMLVTAPVLDAVDLFRGGAILVEPDDYTLDTGTGFVTLVTPTGVGEVFVAHRRINV